MTEVLTGEGSVNNYYEAAVKRLTGDILKMEDQAVVSEGALAIMQRLVEPVLLGLVEEDPDRAISAAQGHQVLRRPDRLLGDRRMVTERVGYDLIHVPLIPKDSNLNVLRMRPPTYWHGFEGKATFDERTHIVTLTATPEQSSQVLEKFREWCIGINAIITDQSPTFVATLTDITGRRLAEASKRRSEFQVRMASLGITVQPKADARYPVDVSVKQEVDLLRTTPESVKGPSEPYLAPSALDAILKVIYQAGRGFETAPGVYSKLDEEDLRTIVVGNLNAVFDSPAVATAETFSHRGKTDILLNLPGGAVLVTECKYWDGAAKNIEALAQLFGYLTWRHTDGLLVTFSRRKGLQRVIEQSQSAMQSHSTYRGAFKVETHSYFTTTHMHPADDQKLVDVHHLFFDLGL